MTSRDDEIPAQDARPRGDRPCAREAPRPRVGANRPRGSRRFYPPANAELACASADTLLSPRRTERAASRKHAESSVVIREVTARRASSTRALRTARDTGARLASAHG